MMKEGHLPMKMRINNEFLNVHIKGENFVKIMTKKGPSLPKWTKPGFVENLFAGANKKPDNFGISRKAEINVPIDLTIGDAKIRWEDTTWRNTRNTEISKNTNPPMSDITDMKTKNAQLQIECEILLNMLTEAELKKATLKRELADKKMIMLKLAARVEAQMAED